MTLRANDLDDLAELLESAYSEIEFPEPKEWMKQVEQVVEAYKNEVELLRQDVRTIRAAMTRINKDHRALMGPVKENNKILVELKQVEEKVKGRA